jgi:excisionase family DNA binding protein
MRGIMERERTYTRKEGEAARLGICKRTLNQWMLERRIPYRKVGKLVLFDPLEVDQALHRHRVAAAGEPRPVKRPAGRIAPATVEG